MLKNRGGGDGILRPKAARLMDPQGRFLSYSLARFRNKHVFPIGRNKQNQQFCEY